MIRERTKVEVRLITIKIRNELGQIMCVGLRLSGKLVTGDTDIAEASGDREPAGEMKLRAAVLNSGPQRFSNSCNFSLITQMQGPMPMVWFF